MGVGRGLSMGRISLIRWTWGWSITSGFPAHIYKFALVDLKFQLYKRHLKFRYVLRASGSDNGRHRSHANSFIMAIGP